MSSPSHTRRGIAATVLIPATLLALAGCGSDKGPTDSSNTAAGYISNVQSGGGTITATYHDGAPPSGSGAAVTATATGAVLVGGSSQLALTAATPFSTVIVSIDGVSGYYELDGVTATASRNGSAPVSADGTGTTTATVILTVGQTPPSNTFNVHVAAGTSVNALGAAATVPVTLTQVGTGDVQVSISWDQPTDVDLHVVDPSGEEIYYGNTTSVSGGTLDLDSNPACDIDNKDNENITWPTGKAPHGTYTVRVDYFERCGSVTQTNYVVTVQVKGQQPHTYSGSLTGDGDAGGEGSGTVVTTFTY